MDFSSYKGGWGKAVLKFRYGLVFLGEFRGVTRGWIVMYGWGGALCGI